MPPSVSAGMPLRLLLVSGWQTINIGDIGHTPGTLRFLQQHVPGADIAVNLRVSNPEVDTMLHRRFPEVDFHGGTINAGGCASNPGLQAAFDTADLVVQNSGMIYNRFWTPCSDLIEACLNRDKPFGIFGQSFDGFDPDQARRFRDLLSRAAFLYTRDTPSLEYLRSLSVTSPVLEFGPDGCFGIDVRDEEKAEAWLSKHGIESGGYLVVVLRSHTPKHSGKNDPLNPVHPLKEDLELDNARAAKLRSLILHWIEKTGRHVVLAPEVDKEIGPARRLLYDALPPAARERVAHRETFWNVDEAASVFARADAVLSMEPHSCIIALANGVPAIHYHSHHHGVKARMFADIGLEGWLHEIDEVPASKVKEALDRILAAPKEAADRVAAAMATVERCAAAMGGRIRGVLGQVDG